MEEHRKKKSVFIHVLGFAKLTVLAAIGVAIVAPTAIIAIVVRACTEGKDTSFPYPSERDKNLE